MAKILVWGVEGFIRGHLVKRTMQDGHQLVCADMKLELWYQIFDENENLQLDKPKWVRVKNNNNDKIINEIVWKLKTNLETEIKKTFDWIQENIKSSDNANKSAKDK